MKLDPRGDEMSSQPNRVLILVEPSKVFKLDGGDLHWMEEVSMSTDLEGRRKVTEKGKQT